MTLCSTCRFWQPITPQWPDLGSCVRRAPLPSKTPMQQAQWPTTHESNWCGEWEGRNA